MNRGLLGEQIYGHLQLYKDLGVRYLGARSGSARSAMAPVIGNRKENHDSSNPVTITADIAAVEQEIVPGETLEAILEDIGNCQRCRLATTRRNLVFGSGNPRAALMFVGEAPGADEDEQGLPFVGRAGRLLTQIIESIELRREEVYICNILKCRPPDNRNPAVDEIAACERFLFRQIAAVQPKVIVALGAFGAQTLLRTTETIGKLRGRLTDYRGAKLMATYHPSYLLRSPLEKRKVWEDMRIVRKCLRALTG